MNIKDYFSFTKGEKRGVVLLLFIILLLIIVIPFMDYFKKNQQTDFSDFENAINEFEEEKHQNQEQIKEQKTTLPTKLFEFNPNTISDSIWATLGFKAWQIKIINNYKAKGGHWKIKNDVAKIYRLSEAHFLKLKPYILLPDEINKSSKKEFEKKNEKPKKSKYDFSVKVNINTANAKELTQLKGIFSEKYGNIIIKYRTQLGGFIKKEQLLEVWNFSQETYDGLINQVELGNTTPKKLNINTSSLDELKKHPYIDWKTANAIVKYRKANGIYTNVDDIKKIHLINNETYLKIAPYITIN